MPITIQELEKMIGNISLSLYILPSENCTAKMTNNAVVLIESILYMVFLHLTKSGEIMIDT